MSEFQTRRRIEFSDTDAGGVVHFSRFFAFMETAEDEFLRSLDASFDMDHEGWPMGWPKVSASCEYENPIRYGDEISITLRVARRSARTVTYEFDFRRGDTPVARGRTISVCCVAKGGAGFESIPIPPDLARRIDGPTE